MDIFTTIYDLNPIQNNDSEKNIHSARTSNINLFMRNSKDPHMLYPEFKHLYLEMVQVLTQNPRKFLQIIMFHRNIKHGNGIKHYYYLGMNLLKSCCLDDSLSKKMILHSYQYSKDLYHFGDIGIQIYSEKIEQQLIQLITPNLEREYEKYDPMLFKYLSYEKGLWKREKTQIQAYLNDVFLKNKDIAYYINSREPLFRPIGYAIRELLAVELNHSDYPVLFTNRVMRKLKSLFNRENRLPEYLFAGKHYDNTSFNVSCNKNKEDTFSQSEIYKIANEISQTAKIAVHLLCKTLKWWYKQTFLEIDREPWDEESSVEHFSKRQQLLLQGYIQYNKDGNNRSGNNRSRNNGDYDKKICNYDLASEAYLCYTRNKYSAMVEERLNEKIEEYRFKWTTRFNESFTVDDFEKNVVLIVDCFPSMEGVEFELNLLYIFMITKIFRIKEIVYFHSSAEIRTFTEEDLDGPILLLLKKVYTRCSTKGTTYLWSAIQLLELHKIENKTVIIVTDSNCDPWQSATKSVLNRMYYSGETEYVSSNKYVILNITEPHLTFPYLNIYENILYVNGTNTLLSIIGAFIQSKYNDVELDADLILDCFLNSSHFKIPEIMFDNKTMFNINRISTDEEDINQHYIAWKKEYPITIHPKIY